MTGYKGITALSTLLPLMGGFCQWYFTPKEKILNFPAVDPATQWLASEPTLVAGATWYGPIKVPNDQLGFEEPQNRDKRGIFYKQKVSGYYPGDDAISRINLENMPYHEYVIVGKQRAGGLWLVLGNDQYGLDFDHDFKSGLSKGAGADFSFTGDALNKALILPTFLGNNTVPPQGVENGGSSFIDYVNNTELIAFNNQTDVSFAWTDTRKNLFGIFPLIEVWVITGGVIQLQGLVPIFVDAQPPATSLFTIKFLDPTTGFVVIK